MDAARDQFFADAGLSGNEHWQVRWSDGLDFSEHRLQRCAATDDVVCQIVCHQLLCNLVLLFDTCFQRCDVLAGFDGGGDCRDIGACFHRVQVIEGTG